MVLACYPTDVGFALFDRFGQSTKFRRTVLLVHPFQGVFCEERDQGSLVTLLDIISLDQRHYFNYSNKKRLSN